jgi:hypothetical protein
MDARDQTGQQIAKTLTLRKKRAVGRPVAIGRRSVHRT